MIANRFSVLFTAAVFFLTVVCGTYTGLFSQSQDNQEITRLLKEADDAYQNGNFKLAIEKYQKLIELFNSKKELAKVKQELLQTMSNLALTYFTIRENEKAEKQLEDLLRVSAVHELDADVYPPKFLELFQKVQNNCLGKLSISTVPAGADILINGAGIGKSPQVLEKYFKGTYELKVGMTGYKTVTKQIEVKPQEATLEAITLEQTAKAKPLVEKKAEKPLPEVKKKKKFPILPVIIGGVAVIAAVALLAGKKKEEAPTPPPQPVEKSFKITNPDVVEIKAGSMGGIISRKMMNVTQSKIITRIRYSITIEHPVWGELFVNINKQNSAAILMIWSKGSKSGRAAIEGETVVFNTLPSNGEWYINVENSGKEPGSILNCVLEFFYME